MALEFYLKLIKDIQSQSLDATGQWWKVPCYHQNCKGHGMILVYEWESLWDFESRTTCR